MLEKNRRARCAPGTTGARVCLRTIEFKNRSECRVRLRTIEFKNRSECRVRLRTIEFKNRSECRVRLRTSYSPNSLLSPVTAPPAQSAGYIPSRT
jgi:hypothetical protein